ncbi:hypothetical protein [Pseudomonas sp. Gutcm_11s]|uniref:hypothetical protein n=1 Tax=Pseudomonas sp. Gutcm_11s TaxID=3026088 RepID=UPI00235F8911|nr:hypothetical protein [Pseudomonas sp. Gutcm_11s]MDD0843804.1 hypothetical protein [Pseudomonas sp. Gutcm_11s]
MKSLTRERYEVPLVQPELSLFLDVLLHQRRILLVNVILNETTQAVYYPSPEIDMLPNEAERACRMALGHFRSKSYLYTQDRRSILRRSVLLLNPLGPLYEGVLLKLLAGAPSEAATVLSER